LVGDEDAGMNGVQYILWAGHGDGSFAIVVLESVFVLKGEYRENTFSSLPA
jgi:hypothetical protein